MASCKALPLLALAACIPTKDVALPRIEGAHSYVLVMFEGGRTAVIALDEMTQVPLSADDSAELHLLAYHRTLAELGLEAGLVDVVETGGRPLPDPTSWVSGSLQGFGDWQSGGLPSQLWQVRVEDLDLGRCWDLGGCSADDPIHCELGCSPDEPMPPAAVEGPPDPPAPPTPPALPTWDPITLEECMLGEAQFWGDIRCRRIGPACPSDGEFASVPAGAIYVDVELAVDGDGSIASPHNRIPDDIPPGSILALAEGTYDLSAHPLLAEVAIYGACVTGTELIDVSLGDRSELHFARLPVGADLTGVVSLYSVESLGRIGSSAVLVGDEISMRNSAIGIEATGAVTIDRFYAKDVTQTALFVIGVLSLTNAVVDGVTASRKVNGAVTVIGPGRIERLYVEDAERFGLLAAATIEGPHEVSEVIVRRTRVLPPIPGDLDDLHRGTIWFTGNGTIDRVLIDDTFERGMLVQTSGTATISNLTIIGVHRSPTSIGEGLIVPFTSGELAVSNVHVQNAFGPGIVFTEQSRGKVTDFTLAAGSTTGGALWALLGSNVEVERADIDGHRMNPISVSDSTLTIRDLQIHGLLESVAGIFVATSTVGPSELDARRVVLKGNSRGALAAWSLGQTIAMRVDHLQIDGGVSAIDLQGGNVDLELNHAHLMNSGFGLLLRGATVSLMNTHLDRTFYGIVINQIATGTPLPTILTVDGLQGDVQEQALIMDQSEANATLRNVRLTSGRGIKCSGSPFDSPRMELRMEGVAIETSDLVDAVGIDVVSCDLIAKDIAVKGVPGLGATISEFDAGIVDTKVEIERFLFEGNTTGMRAGIPLLLTNGMFRGNNVGLDLGGVKPQASQLLGVSFVDNGVPLD